MAHKAKIIDISINLAPKDPFYDSFVGKILQWALSVGRYIVVFTELIVIVSFLARFYLDKQLTDLNTDLHEKQTFIESYGDLESRLRTIQGKLDQYQQSEQQNNLADIFPILTKITPADVELEQLVIEPGRVHITGFALTQNSVNVLINNMLLTPTFKTVFLESLNAAKQELDQRKFKFQITGST